MCGLFGFSDLQHSLTEKQASALANSLAAPVQFVGRMQQELPTYRVENCVYTSARNLPRRDATAAPQRHDPTAGPCADDDPGEREEKL